MNRLNWVLNVCPDTYISQIMYAYLKYAAMAFSDEYFT